MATWNPGFKISLCFEHSWSQYLRFGSWTVLSLHFSAQQNAVGLQVGLDSGIREGSWKDPEVSKVANKRTSQWNNFLLLTFLTCYTHPFRGKIILLKKLCWSVPSDHQVTTTLSTCRTTSASSGTLPLPSLTSQILRVQGTLGPKRHLEMNQIQTHWKHISEMH